MRLLTAQVETFKVLGVLDLLDPERQVRASDADVEQLSHQANQCRHDIKAVLNLAISEKMTPIAVVQALLSKLGLKLTCIGRDVADDGRRGGARVYQYQPPNDDRDTIFVQWQQRDAIAQEKQVNAANATAPATVLTAAIDPPSDIYSLDQSFSGSKSHTSEHAKILQPSRSSRIVSAVPEVVVADNREEEQSQVPEIRVGSLVKRVHQAYSWVVMRLGGATAKLQQLHGVLECTVPLSDLIVVPIGDST